MKKNYLITLILALAVAFTLSSCGDKIEPPASLPKYDGVRVPLKYDVIYVYLKDSGKYSADITVNLDGFQPETHKIEFEFNKLQDCVEDIKSKTYKLPVGATVTIEYNGDNNSDLYAIDHLYYYDADGKTEKADYNPINNKTISFTMSMFGNWIEFNIDHR